MTGPNQKPNTEPVVSNTSDAFEKDIKRIMDETLKSTSTEQIIMECTQTAMKNAIEKSFQWGALSTAIENKVKEILVPYIEGHDMKEFIPKLDTILTDICNQTTLSDNKVLLENFKSLMLEPAKEEISLDDMFDAYCNFMAKNVNTSRLDVNCDEGPHYESFECYVEVEPIHRESSIYERVLLHFSSEVETDTGSADYTVELSRWKDGKDRRYDIHFYDISPTLDSLRYLNDFQIYLLQLSRSTTKMENPDRDEYTSMNGMSTEVEPEAEPEPTFQ